VTGGAPRDGAARYDVRALRGCFVIDATLVADRLSRAGGHPYEHRVRRVKQRGRSAVLAGLRRRPALAGGWAPIRHCPPDAQTLCGLGLSG
jgi:hypothetical protein